MADVASRTEADTITSPSERPEAPPKSRRSVLWILIPILAVLIVGGYFLRNYFSTYESTDDAQVDGDIHAISARVSGYVTEVNVTDNQVVQKGAILVRIDPKDYEVA